jgi:hypothetical protein
MLSYAAVPHTISPFHPEGMEDVATAYLFCVGVIQLPIGHRPVHKLSILQGGLQQG